MLRMRSASLKIQAAAYNGARTVSGFKKKPPWKNMIYLFPTNNLYLFMNFELRFWPKVITQGPDKTFRLFFDIQLLLEIQNWGLVIFSWNVSNLYSIFYSYWIKFIDFVLTKSFSASVSVTDMLLRILLSYWIKFWTTIECSRYSRYFLRKKGTNSL